MSTLPPNTRFPPVETADPDGLLLIGGELTPSWLLEAYRRGINPWPISDGNKMYLGWWSPDPRSILELDGLHISRRLQRTIRGGPFTATLNHDFAGVVAGCAEPRNADDGTWITPEMARAYERLHELGHAHSVEVWREGQLAGGVYGVAVGGVFCGESMFHRERDASKVALAHLVNHLRARGFVLLDIQQWTPHMARMGASEISRSEYLHRLQQAIELAGSMGERLEGLSCSH